MCRKLPSGWVYLALVKTVEGYLKTWEKELDEYSLCWYGKTVSLCRIILSYCVCDCHCCLWNHCALFSGTVSSCCWKERVILHSALLIRNQKSSASVKDTESTEHEQIIVLVDLSPCLCVHSFDSSFFLVEFLCFRVFFKRVFLYPIRWYIFIAINQSYWIMKIKGTYS